LAQKWTSIDVPWSATYHEKFRFAVKAATPVVIVLSQLDDRYFKGLEGQYSFKLHFRLHSHENLDSENYIARSHGNSVMNRSVVADLPDLQPGRYSVFVRVFALRDTNKAPVEKVVEKMCRSKTDDEKFSQVGLSYNMAHAKCASHMEAQVKMRVREEEKKERRRQKREKWKSLREERKKSRWTERHIQKHGDKNAVLLNGIIPTDVAEGIDNISPPKRRDTAPATLTNSPILVTTALPLRGIGNANGVVAPSKSEDPSPSINALMRSETSKTIRDSKTISEVLPEDGNREIAIPASDLIPDLKDNPRVPFDPLTDTDSEDGRSSDSEDQREKLQSLSYDRPGDDDYDDTDPWNAVCIVGLRLYSKDPDLDIEAVMPGQEAKTGLDIDDKLADMTAQVDPGKKSRKYKESAVDAERY
jgi:hypothetical protein